MEGTSKQESARGGTDGRVRLTAPTKRVAKAAAQALIIANDKRGVASDAKTQWLAKS